MIKKKKNSAMAPFTLQKRVSCLSGGVQRQSQLRRSHLAAAAVSTAAVAASTAAAAVRRR
ncbi:unnamed protein product [Cuscuta epithymum]|uniref:Uncharacterized protein n=1 Tax=Cuscuta epithymum TaxID=186058 RepID=A0AAV0DTA8_9ASTE|nr:unnamed protein product [Cuscuta epithymum]CAH9142529.1 unnamed protein product [Cuscuta epithymum]